MQLEAQHIQNENQTCQTTEKQALEREDDQHLSQHVEQFQREQESQAALSVTFPIPYRPADLTMAQSIWAQLKSAEGVIVPILHGLA